MKIGTMELIGVPDVRSEMCMIGPVEAKKLLERNTHNRKIAEHAVERYTGEMRYGEWMPCAAGIGIDSNGVLTDGQHRLKAVIAYGSAVPLLIVTGLPPKSQMKQDRHNKRSLASVFLLSGVCKSNRIVQAATFLAQMGTNDDVCDSEIEACLNTHREALEYVDKIDTRKKGISTAGVRAALTLAIETNGEKGRRFTSSLFSDAYIPVRQDDPIWKLKRCLSGESGTVRSKIGGGSPQVLAFRRTCYAFNAYNKGRFINSVLQDDGIKTA
jgi:hypothetical protein